jgi:hypothetical protein
VREKGEGRREKKGKGREGRRKIGYKRSRVQTGEGGKMKRIE